MITFRPYQPEDYATLLGWWAGHKALPVPEILLPRGWFALADGVEAAASFIYIAEGKIAVIEWTTTNPACSGFRTPLLAVKGLFNFLEEQAKEAGCLMVLSFVKPNGSEEHILKREGWATSQDDPGHRLFAKPIVGQEHWVQPAGGVL